MVLAYTQGIGIARQISQRLIYHQKDRGSEIKIVLPCKTGKINSNKAALKNMVPGRDIVLCTLNSAHPTLIRTFFRVKPCVISDISLSLPENSDIQQRRQRRGVLRPNLKPFSATHVRFPLPWTIVQSSYSQLSSPNHSKT